MKVPAPSISARLLPLLDIIFLLLAFFIILPQGVPEKKKANVREEKFSSDAKSLSTHRFVYLDLTREFVRVEYQMIQGTKYIRRKRLISESEFIESGLTPPATLINIVELVRTQVKQRDPKQDIMLILRYELQAPVFISRVIGNFAESNRFTYAISPILPSSK